MKALQTRLDRLEAVRGTARPVVFMRTPEGLRVAGTNGFRSPRPSESPEEFLQAAKGSGRAVMVIRLVAEPLACEMDAR